MVFKPSRRSAIGAGLLALAALSTGATLTAAQDIPATAEPGPIKMGIEPWLGYGQWHIAAKKKLFEKEGLDDVEVVNFNTDADINAALAAGQLQAGNIATHTAMNFIANGLPIRIVALLDVSKTDDAIISDGSVTDIAGLKGKQVAYEEGTTSDILLNYALASQGMTAADIRKVPMPASDAGAALLGRTTAALGSDFDDLVRRSGHDPETLARTLHDIHRVLLASDTTDTNDTQPPGRPPRLWVRAVCGSDSWRSPACPRNCSHAS